MSGRTSDLRPLELMDAGLVTRRPLGVAGDDRSQCRAPARLAAVGEAVRRNEAGET